jgi:hypothetical protein
MVENKNITARSRKQNKITQSNIKRLLMSIIGKKKAPVRQDQFDG